MPAVLSSMKLRLVACALSGALVGPLPASAAGVYFVKEGDTAAGIARVFGLEPASLLAANRVDHELRPGDRLRIPDPLATPGVAPQPPAPRVALETRIASVACRDETVYHRVEKGDTLTAIARRYGTSVAGIETLNALRPAAVLRIGRRLVVRRSGPKTHLVRRGDTLAAIAARAGLQVEEVRRFNGLTDDLIVAGRRLLLEPCDARDPATQIPTPPAASATAAAAWPAPTAIPAAAPGIVERLAGYARTMLGIPYRFGGTTLRGLDCSAYVQRVFGFVETPLPRTAREQFAVGEAVPRADLAAGDLVFFRTYAAYPSHVGIYLGDDLFIHASSVLRKVTIDSLERPYFLQHFLGARRVLGDAAASIAATGR